MKAGLPMLQLTGYYLLIALLAYLFLMIPGLEDRLPVGGSVTDAGVAEFTSGQVNKISWEPLDQSIRLGIALLGVLVLMFPITWIYLGVRRKKGKEQSFLLTLLVLPLAVAAIVMIVQNSLALAFSLAGIVAGVRFRLTLEDTLDAVYIFLAIGVGLAAGIEALEIAGMLTLFFNYAILMFWQVDYGEEYVGARWFTRTWMNKGEEEKSSRES